MAISIDNLNKVICDTLSLYNNKIVIGMKKINDECTAEFVNATKKDAPRGNRRKNKYYTKITSKVLSETPNSKTNIWYVKNPQYRLTHLLKNGHATRNGGRTKSQDFITSNYEKLVRNYNDGIEEVIKNGY